MIMTCKIYRRVIRLLPAFLLIVMCNGNSFAFDYNSPSVVFIEDGRLRIVGGLGDKLYKIPGCFDNLFFWYSNFTVRLYYCHKSGDARRLMDRITTIVTFNTPGRERDGNMAYFSNYKPVVYPVYANYSNWIWHISFNQYDWPAYQWGSWDHGYPDSVIINRSASIPLYCLSSSINSGAVPWQNHYHPGIATCVFSTVSGETPLMEVDCTQCKTDLSLVKTRITSEASSILTLYNNSYQGFTKLLPCNSLICLSDYSSYFSAIANSVPILGLFAATMIVFRRKRQPRKTQGK